MWVSVDLHGWASVEKDHLLQRMLHVQRSKRLEDGSLFTSLCIVYSKTSYIRKCVGLAGQMRSAPNSGTMPKAVV